MVFLNELGEPTIYEFQTMVTNEVSEILPLYPSEDVGTMVRGRGPRRDGAGGRRGGSSH